MISELVKDLRTKKGFSQRQLAYLAGVSNTEISRIEKGERSNPDPLLLQKLAKPLNIDYIELYKAAGYIKQDPAISEIERKKAEIKNALTTLVAHDEGEFPITDDLINTIYDAMMKGREFHAKRKNQDKKS